MSVVKEKCPRCIRLVALGEEGEVFCRAHDYPEKPIKPIVCNSFEVRKVTAYLVGMLGIDGEPEYRGCNIYTEPSPTMHGTRVWPFVITEASAESYEQAQANIMDQLEHPSLRWAKRSLGKDL